MTSVSLPATSKTEVLTELATEISSSSFISSSLSPGGREEVSSDVAFLHRAIISVCLLVVFFVGCSGNALVIVSVIVSRKLQTTTNILVVSLAVADFVVCFTLPLQVSMILSDVDNWPFPEIVCVLVVALSFTSICCSVLTLGSIAVIRWYVITKSIRGDRGFNTHRRVSFVAIATWVVSSVFMIVPPYVGIGSIGISEYYHLCSVTDDNPTNFMYVSLQGAILFVTLTVTGIFYLLILRFVLASSKNFRLQFADSSVGTSGGANNSSNSTFDRREIDITKNLFIVVCVFVICFLPTVVNFFIPGASVITLYTSTFLTINSSLNPIIYGLKHPSFKEVFRCLLTGNLEGIPQPSSLLKRHKTKASKNHSQRVTGRDASSSV
ncbi:mu-type opioid receptor-like [Diadema setosum]|uniref:mu-type opioid receptor-like n=1 Tax=Diadema setosum TaxID=31175 RepID=UPI003B3A142F